MSAAGYTPKLVELNGVQLWWLVDDIDGSGGLAPLSQCDENGYLTTWRGDLSFGHVDADGRIWKLGRVIGHRNDLKEVGIIETTARKV